MGIGHQNGRRVKVLSCRQVPGKEPVVDAHDQAGLVILVQLRFRQKAARIHKGKAVAGAVVLIGIPFDQGNEGILLMGGNAPSAADLVDMMGQALPFHLSLLAVTSRKRDQIQVSAVHKVHVHGHDPLECNGPAAPVMDPGRPHDDICLLKDRIQKGDPYLCNGILKGQFQGICPVFFPCKGRGKPL